jgi:hypothetical protein
MLPSAPGRHQDCAQVTFPEKAHGNIKSQTSPGHTGKKRTFVDSFYVSNSAVTTENKEWELLYRM